MQEKLKKIVSWGGYIIFFVTHFYVLFVNLAHSFLLFVDSFAAKIFVVAVAAAFSALMPAIICCQHHRIKELEDGLRMSDLPQTGSLLS